MAQIREFVTTLEASLDTGALPPGTYGLALRQRGADWRLIPVEVRKGHSSVDHVDAQAVLARRREAARAAARARESVPLSPAT